MKVFYTKLVYWNSKINPDLNVLQNQAHSHIAKENIKKFKLQVSEVYSHGYQVMVNSGYHANLLALKSPSFPKRTNFITPALSLTTTIALMVEQGQIPDTPKLLIIENSTDTIENNLHEQKSES